MARTQRVCWISISLHFFLLSLVLCRYTVVADRNHFFYNTSFCLNDDGIHKKIDGAVVTSQSEIDRRCTITFRTDSILQKFMLRFEKLALDCNDHLFIYDGSHASGTYKEDFSCRDSHSSVGTIFTRTNFVTLKYETGDFNTHGNGFTLVITAIKNPPMTCTDFRCSNGFCISNDLKCDRVNHCGDNSDERGSDKLICSSGIPSSIPSWAGLFVCLTSCFFALVPVRI